MDDLHNIGYDSSKKKAPIWKLIWRKMKKNYLLERCSNFNFKSKSSSMRFTYDLNSYSQNFDQGSSDWVDSQEYSRSFSARFVVPSRIFPKDELIA
ncbi:hypothetical protein R3W88_031514 [Solanum pinnatisectum]|uniref:Uncharacterized protein n=1 Tax=Solanum pinnatisectum TaxID=50273 RepID=A0AAV9LQE8_9SOLN|nr:hypothetical protein R3W88_031514 [Solanum pinnatisectum]